MGEPVWSGVAECVETVTTFEQPAIFLCRGRRLAGPVWKFVQQKNSIVRAFRPAPPSNKAGAAFVPSKPFTETQKSIHPFPDRLLP
jgi:hypothetical protein